MKLSTQTAPKYPTPTRKRASEMTTTTLTLVLTHPDGTTADGLTQYTLAPMLRDINDDAPKGWTITLSTTEQEREQVR